MEDSKEKDRENNTDKTYLKFSGGHPLIDISGYIALLCVGIYVVISKI